MASRLFTFVTEHDGATMVKQLRGSSLAAHGRLLAR